MPTGIRPPARSSQRIPLGIALGFLISASSGISEPRRLVAEEPHMGLVIRIEAYVPEDVNPARAFRAAFDRVGELERKLSSYREDSELREIERKAWRARVPVSGDLAFVLSRAIELARHSDGAFDPTLGRVTRLVRARGWGRAGPKPSDLRDAWKLTGWRDVEVDQASRTVFIHRRGLQIDLGGIAKGFIADEALKTLRAAGVARALVSIGGDIVAGAPPPGMDGWRVKLEQLADRGDGDFHLPLRNEAVSTSGSRERYFIAGDQTCSHILARDASDCVDVSIAASVVASSGLEGDSLATALVALGRARSAGLLARHPNVRVYWNSQDALDSLPRHQRMPSTDSQR